MNYNKVFLNVWVAIEFKALEIKNGIVIYFCEEVQVFYLTNEVREKTGEKNSLHLFQTFNHKLNILNIFAIVRIPF